MYMNDVERLLNEGVPVVKIVDKYGEKYCVHDFEMKNENCNENMDCKDCWNACLENKLRNGDKK